MTKTCPRCCEAKSLDSFNRNRSTKDGLAVYCRNCANQYHRAWLTGSDIGPASPKAQAYRERKVQLARERRQARSRVATRKRGHSRQRFINAIRLSLVCVDCGWAPDESTRGRLHFDHHDPSRKIAQNRVGRSALELSWTLAQIAEEVLLHCDPRCLSCHKKRTAEQLRAAWRMAHAATI